MADDELVSILEAVGERFDLTDYEIDAYLAILERGSITATRLADQTSIPQPRVYDTVRSLNDRGLVELHESRPMTVVAIDPTEAFDDVTASLEELITQLTTRYTAPGPEREAVSLVKSRSTILRHLHGIIDQAEYELTLSLTPDLLTRYEKSLREARSRGVSVELIVTPASRAPDLDRYPYQDIATTVRSRRGITTPVIAVGDGTQSVYATQDAIREDNDRYGVIFTRSSLGFLISGFFGTVLWTTSEPLVNVDVEVSFPRRYASIRRCIKDLRRLDGPFFATIAGRWVESGDPCELTGRIEHVAIEETVEVAAMTIVTEAGEYTIGGRVASLEDVEAHEIEVSRSQVSTTES